MKLLVAALAATALTAPAAAATTFKGSYTVSVNNPGNPGLEILTEKLSDPFNFTLGLNGSTEVDLFRIWTQETTVNAGRGNNDDVIPRPITLNFTFTQPTGPGGGVSGQTVGVNLFVTHFGLLTWDNPVQTFTFANNNVLQVTLENNVTFNAGLFALRPGKEFGENVSATFKLTAVPEPATWAMMIGGFGLAGTAMRRRRSVASVVIA